MSAISSFVTRTWLKLSADLAVIFRRDARALELYREIAAVAPDDLKARATVGAMLAERGDLAGAASAFEAVVNDDPDYADAWFNLGFVEEKRDRLDTAEQAFRRAVHLNPSLDRAWYGLALLLIRTDRLPEAIEALKKNIALQPFSPYGYYQLGMTHHHLGHAAEAKRVCERLQGFEPKYAATLRRDMERTPPRAFQATASTGGQARDGTTVSPQPT